MQRLCHSPKVTQKVGIAPSVPGLGLFSLPIVPEAGQPASPLPREGPRGRGRGERPQQLRVDEGQQVLGQLEEHAEEEAGAKGGHQGPQEGGLLSLGPAPQQHLTLAGQSLPRSFRSLVSGPGRKEQWVGMGTWAP